MAERNITLSVCMIVKNEEVQLKECIESIRNIANEIIIVDNGSTDNTFNIALEMGCKVYDGSGLSESEARNLSLSKAMSEWILIIDGDERFERNDTTLLFKVLADASEKVAAIELLRMDYIGYGKWGEIPLVRIVRNGLGVKYNSSSIHPSMVPDIRAMKLEIQKEDIRLHHFDILQAERAPKKRAAYKNKILQMLNDYYSENVSRITADYIQDLDTYLGLELYAEGNITEARKLWDKVVANGEPNIRLAINLICYMDIEWEEYNDLNKMLNTYSSYIMNPAIWGNYYYQKSIDLCIDYYFDQIKRHVNKYSSYINLAYLIQDRKPDMAKKIIIKAVKNNTYLLDKRIYGEGAEPNIMKLQNSIIKPIKDLKELYEKMGMIIK